MVDAVTVGTIVATALSLAAEAALKSGIGEAAKDGYKVLKEKVSSWAFNEVTALETTPASKAQQAVIAEIIDAQTEDERKLLRQLAETLIEKLKENDSAIGIDITGRLTADEIDLSDLSVSDGRGLRANEADIGVLKAPGMSVGKRSGK